MKFFGWKLAGCEVLCLVFLCGFLIWFGVGL